MATFFTLCSRAVPNGVLISRDSRWSARFPPCTPAGNPKELSATSWLLLSAGKAGGLQIAAHSLVQRNSSSGVSLRSSSNVQGRISLPLSHHQIIRIHY